MFYGANESVKLNLNMILKEKKSNITTRRTTLGEIMEKCADTILIFISKCILYDRTGWINNGNGFAAMYQNK